MHGKLMIFVPMLLLTANNRFAHKKPIYCIWQNAIDYEAKGFLLLTHNI